MKNSKKNVKRNDEKEVSKKPKLKPISHKEYKNLKNKLLSEDEEELEDIDDPLGFNLDDDIEEEE